MVSFRLYEDAKNFITNNYLVNPNSSFPDKIKLKQVTKDWAAYSALVNGTASEPSIIKNAYDSFCKLLADQRAENQNVTVEEYIRAIGRLNVAVIFLDERPFKGEDPQIIFETLNSLGKPLTLSDLIRNYVLLDMKSEEQSVIYNDKWFPQIEKQLGDEASNFFRDFLQFKKSAQIKAVSDGNTKEIYAQFKAFVHSEYNSHDKFIDDIISYVKFYKFIITEKIADSISVDAQKDLEIKELLRNIFHDIKSEAFKPFVMGLLFWHSQKAGSKEEISDDELLCILKIVRSYLIRRRILKLTQGENKSIVLLCRRIEDLAECKTDMTRLLSTQPYNLRFPNDTEISEALESSNFYEEFQRYGKFVLGKIEEHNAKVAVDFRDSKITIEHIMPQTLSPEWEKMIGTNFSEVHEKYLHNIGNLILTEFNGEIGNNPFALKKKKLAESSLHYRLDVTGEAKWTEQEIKTHRAKMISEFLETFDLPEEYRKTQNWNKDVEQQINDFSPLDDDARELAEGRKPQKLFIGEKNFEVSTWQDVYLIFFKFIKEDKNYGLEIVLNNQLEIFNAEDGILSLFELENKIEDDDSCKKKYKSFDGVFYGDLTSLQNDDMFIHTNISAYVCMRRIGKVMAKFNMPKDFVKITSVPKRKKNRIGK